LFFFDKHDDGTGQNVLIHAGLRKQWLSANEAYDTKVQRKLVAKQKPATVQKALPPASERNVLTVEEFSRLVGKPVTQIQSLIATGQVKTMGQGIHRDESRKFQA
jgi:hypothetical protein